MEQFKGRSSGRSRTKSRVNNNAVISPGIGTAIGVGSLATMSSSGKNETCPINDTSFFCRLNRFVSILSMLIYIIVIVAMFLYFAYMVYQLFFAKQ